MFSGLESSKNYKKDEMSKYKEKFMWVWVVLQYLYALEEYREGREDYPYSSRSMN